MCITSVSESPAMSSYSRLRKTPLRADMRIRTLLTLLCFLMRASAMRSFFPFNESGMSIIATDFSLFPSISNDEGTIESSFMPSSPCSSFFRVIIGFYSLEINKALMIIAIAGLIGSGKDEVTGYISRKYGYHVIDYAGILRGICRDEGLEVTRDNMQNLRLKYGNTFLAEAVVKRIKKSGEKKIILTPMRRSEDYEIPRREFGDQVKLILIESDAKERFDRLKKRGRENDPKDFKEFERQEKRENEIFNFDKTFSYADFTVKNNGSIDEMKKNIDKVMRDENV